MGDGGRSVEKPWSVDEDSAGGRLRHAARYWMEGHYVFRDDAAAGNAFDNATHRAVTVGPGPDFDLGFSAPAVPGQAAIHAWKSVDPAVEIEAVDVAGTPVERFQVARRVTGSSPLWHYEYAIGNLNSDRSARRFAVVFPSGATISGAGFADVDHHSGEPYATTDWAIDTSVPNTMPWSTDDFATDANANALRWATTFTFWFDADAPPSGNLQHTLGLFKPGSPAEVPFSFLGAIFADGFEGGSFAAWDLTVP